MVIGTYEANNSKIFDPPPLMSLDTYSLPCLLNISVCTTDWKQMKVEFLQAGKKKHFFPNCIGNYYK
jgi:hypothetical protein